MCAFVVKFCFSCQAKKLAWERVRNDLFCVEWDVKLQLSQSISCNVCKQFASISLSQLLFSGHFSRRGSTSKMIGRSHAMKSVSSTAVDAHYDVLLVVCQVLCVKVASVTSSEGFLV